MGTKYIAKINKDNSIGSWNERKSLFKQKFSGLTDNDVTFETGKAEEMLGNLEINLGKTREELHSIIRGL